MNFMELVQDYAQWWILMLESPNIAVSITDISW